MHVIARPAGELEGSFDDRAVTVAAAAAGVGVAPLSACYAGRRKKHGLILGYAGTPEPEIGTGILKLQRVLRDQHRTASVDKSSTCQ